MLLVRSSVRPSAIHGLGCFAEEDIRQGQVVWIPDARIDLFLPLSEVALLPEASRDFLSTYGYMDLREGRPVVVLCGDHARHMNHAPDPNLSEGDGGTNVAARDIAAGEELTCNYFDFDVDAHRKLALSH